MLKQSGFDPRFLLTLIILNFVLYLPQSKAQLTAQSKDQSNAQLTTQSNAQLTAQSQEVSKAQLDFQKQSDEQDQVDLLLIKKLEIVHRSLALTDPNRVSVTLRLADLLSQKARQQAQAELAQGESAAEIQNQSAQTRSKSLKLYQEVVDKVTGEQQAKIYLQMGHLSDLLGDLDKALNSYDKVNMVTGASQVLKGEALLARAEVFYKKRVWSKALTDYEGAINLLSSRKGYALFRKAWVLFEINQLDSSLVTLSYLLDHPEWLTSFYSVSAQIDTEFAGEVLRDYSRFLAKKGQYTQEQVGQVAQWIAKLSIASFEPLYILAQESERLGRPADSFLAWDYIYQNEKSAPHRTYALVYKAQTQWLRQDKSQAFELLVLTFDHLKDHKTKNDFPQDLAQEVQKITHSLLVNWYQSQKLSPSIEIAKLFSLYLEVYPQEPEMSEWLALIYSQQKEFLLAYHQFIKTSELLINDKTNHERLMLLALIQAEESKDQELLKNSLVNYLKNSQTQSKNIQVSYQLAKWYYDHSQFEPALSLFDSIIKSKSAPNELKLTSAHLVLDILGQQKQDSQIRQSAQEFAKIFSSNKSDFLKIEFKAALNQAATLGQTDSVKAYQILSHYSDLSEIELDDQITFLKNKIILAEKNKNLTQALLATNDLLITKNLSKSDWSWAMTKKAWFLELNLDFAEAAQTIKQLGVTQYDLALKVAIFGQLASKPELLDFQKAIELAPNDELKVSLFFETLAFSKDPLVTLNKLYPKFVKLTPDQLAKAYVTIYNFNQQEGPVLKTVLNNSEINKTSWGQLLVRIHFLKDLEKLNGALKNHELNAANEKLLSKSLKAWIVTLNKLEALSNTAIASQDWASQVTSLSYLANENQRLYQALMALPAPEGLTEQEQNQYMSLLMDQAQPFQSKALMIETKLFELWSKSQWENAYLTTITDYPDLAYLLEPEILVLKQIAKGQQGAVVEKLQSKLSGLKLIQQEQRNPALFSDQIKQVSEQRLKVKNNPYDLTLTQELLNSENLLGHKAMTSYLKARLESLSQQNQENQ